MTSSVILTLMTLMTMMNKEVAGMKKILDKNRSCWKIREMCFERNVPVSVLTEELDVSPQTIYGWFSGKKLPSIDHLVELAGLLDVCISDLIVTKELREERDVSEGQFGMREMPIAG